MTISIGLDPCADVLIFLVGLVFLAAGLYMVRDSLRFRRHGIITIGQIIALRSGGVRGGFHPVILFIEPSHETTLEFTEKTGISPLPKRYNVGREVRIRYLPKDPYQARIAWVWNSPLMGLLIIALSFFV